MSKRQRLVIQANITEFISIGGVGRIAAEAGETVRRMERAHPPCAAFAQNFVAVGAAVGMWSATALAAVRRVYGRQLLLREFRIFRIRFGGHTRA